jgi:Zn finger protein HypA/HybF involved in hydrogenase expression
MKNNPRDRFVWKPGDLELITKHCPKCGSENTIPILWGYPSQALFKAAEQGLVKLGGCVIGEDEPDTFCKDCQHEWSEESTL